MHSLRQLTSSNCWYDTYDFGQGKQLSCPHIFDTHHNYTGNCPVFSSLDEARQACDQVESCDAINFKRTGDTCFKNCSGAFTYINGGPNWMSSVRSCPPSPPTFPPSHLRVHRHQVPNKIRISRSLTADGPTFVVVTTRVTQ